MLVLSRKPHEKLHIGDDIVVTVVSISGGRVRLGFEAPAEVKVYRSEIAARLQGELEISGLENSASLPATS